MRSGLVGGLCLLLTLIGHAKANDNPFGLEWGSTNAIPRPSLAGREANITTLFYQHGTPPATTPDTEQVILEVCREEGLQQVIWISRELSAVEAKRRYDTIYAEGVRRYGAPEPGPQAGMIAWDAGRTLLYSHEHSDGSKRLLMLARGDRYGSCSKAHDVATGHAASDHALNLFKHF